MANLFAIILDLHPSRARNIGTRLCDFFSFLLPHLALNRNSTSLFSFCLVLSRFESPSSPTNFRAVHYTSLLISRPSFVFLTYSLCFLLLFHVLLLLLFYLLLYFHLILTPPPHNSTCFSCFLFRSRNCIFYFSSAPLYAGSLV